MKRFIGVVLFKLFVLLFLVSPTLAEYSSEEIVVSATRISEPKKESTRYITVITKEDIKSMVTTSTNIGDLIEKMGLGHIHKYPGSLTAKITLRGFSSDSMGDPFKGGVLILLNGHPIGLTNLATVPVDDIERIEVIRGTSSALYGSQGMGGVINIITKEASEKGLHSSVKLTAGSFQYRKGYLNLSYKTDTLSIYGSYGREKSDNYEVKNLGVYNNTDYENHNGYISLVFEPTKDHKFFGRILSWHGWDIGSPGPLYSPSPHAETDRLKTVYEGGYEGTFGKLTLYHVIDHYTYTDPNWGYKSKSNYNTEGIDYNKSFNILNSTVLIGGSYNRIYSEQPVLKPNQPKADHINYALYAIIEKRLFERLTINLSGRYDYYRLKILPTGGIKVNPSTEDEDQFTYNIGFRYVLFDWISIKGNFGKGFRVPTPLERTGNYTTTYRTWIGNPALKPEKAYNLDGGVDINKGPLGLYLGAFYYNYLDKIISYQVKKSYYSYKNTPGARISGVEMEGSLELAELLKLPISLKPYFNLTYLTTYHLDRPENNERRITYLPDWVGSIGIRASGEKFWFDVSGRYNGREKVDDWNFYSKTYGQIIDKGGYTVLYLSMGVKPIKNLEISLGIENLLNRYYEVVKDYPASKINTKLSVSYKF